MSPMTELAPEGLEVAREKETFLYSFRLFDSVRATSRAATGDGDTSAPLQLSWPPDPVLTAFAQLTLLKLNVTRCLISLFDQDHQYIVAQADPSCAHTTLAQQKESGLSEDTVPRHLSVCDSVLRRHDYCNPGVGDAPSQTLPVLVIPDLRHEAPHCFRPNVRDVFYKRFYAGVPIKSPGGIDIGVLCVYDEQPRPNLDGAHLQILQEMSRTIMGRLSTLALMDGSERSERMLRGIGTFLRQKTAPYGLRSARPGSKSATVGVDTGEEEEGVVSTPAIDSHESYSGTGKQDVEQLPERPALVPLQKSTGTVTDGRPETGPADQHRTVSGTTTASFGGELVQREIETIFDAAASTIRDSIEADGVYFLDATVSSYGNLSDAVRPADRPPPGDSQAPQPTLDHQDEGEKTCHIIGDSLLNTDDSWEPCQSLLPLSVPESLLQRLLGHYPQGTIFNYGRTGASIHPNSALDLDLNHYYARNLSEEPNMPSILTQPKLRKEARRKDSDAIHQLLPGARCVAFVPVWSSRLERWYAGSLVWTRDAARAFTTDSELTYLQTFGATIMTEVARINTLAAERAKYDLLGSVSHELRSPLHGIIASAELLHDTDLDPSQGDVLRSIESCGRTLLDVLDHLLDFTKINRLNKGHQEHSTSVDTLQGLRTERHQNFKSQMATLTSNIQLDALVEETVESVFTGYNFHDTSVPQLLAQEDQQYRPTIASRNNSSTANGPWGSVLRRVTTMALSVYLDVHPGITWHCRTQPGALRRVIMNLVGNSLKFTKEGWIHVRLQQEPVGKYLILTVSDTGPGITAEFLQNHLFAPFAQEDHLTPGAGLGLSLVHDVVEAFNGTIRIDSQPGHGTVATVTLPCYPQAGDSGQDTLFGQNLLALKGLRVSVVGLSSDLQCTVLPGQTPFCEQTMMEQLCVEWLDLDLIPPDTPEVRPDLLLCTESTLNQVVRSGVYALLPPIVVICRSAVAAHTLSNSHKARGWGGVLECITQPAGPRKVARAMVLAMERNNDLADQEVPTEPPGMATMRSRPSSQVAIEQPTEGIPHDTNVESKSSIPSTDSSYFNLSSPLAMRPRVYRNPSYATPSPSPGLPPPAGGSNVSLANIKERTKYLLVDDNKLNLKASNAILIALMKKLKRDWKTAENGLEAVEAYAKEPEAYAGVLMDLSMPVMDGFEATRRIREHEKAQCLAPTTVIALTGLASRSAQEEAFASGVDVFMTKPARLKELAEVVAKNDETGDST
ncbi:sensor histidine kinase response [Apiospora hydei]|uniref:histidine kinase n=1 Tax=Apiospora hydei TaxID=1337664 RepID=A0ABR1WC91_9PEZI